MAVVVVEESFIYARVGVAGGSPVLQLRVLSEDDAYDANGDLTAEEADWRKVTLATEAYFAAFYAEALTPLATDALARALGVDGRPGDTLAALEERYLPAFFAMLRTAHEAARRLHADPEALPGWDG